jgi:hypothetical protein
VILSSQNLHGELVRISWRVDRGRYQDEMGRDLCGRLPKTPVPGTVVSVDATLPMGYINDAHIDELNAPYLEGWHAELSISNEPVAVGILFGSEGGNIVGSLFGSTLDIHRQPPLSQWQSSEIGGFVANLGGLSDCSFVGEAISANFYVGGDSNLDGVFDSSDFVTVFQPGQYEDAIALNSTWETGDWDGDREFNSRDLVQVFTEGYYQADALRPATAVVPEPTAAALAFAACFAGGLAVRSRGAQFRLTKLTK